MLNPVLHAADVVARIVFEYMCLRGVPGVGGDGGDGGDGGVGGDGGDGGGPHSI